MDADPRLERPSAGRKAMAVQAAEEPVVKRHWGCNTDKGLVMRCAVRGNLYGGVPPEREQQEDLFRAADEKTCCGQVDLESLLDI